MTNKCKRERVCIMYNTEEEKEKEKEGGRGGNTDVVWQGGIKMKKKIKINDFDPKTNEKCPFKGPNFKKFQGTKY